MMTAAEGHTRVAEGRSASPPWLAAFAYAPPTPLERRALVDLLFTACCTVRNVLGCCNRCWSRWIRARTMEHLFGVQYWEELDRDDFALLRGKIHPNRSLVAEIVTAIEAGGENLDLIVWAFDVEKAIDDVLAILTTIDLNARRLPRFAWLPQVRHGSPDR